MDIAVIGGGASGMIAAITAADLGACVTIIEHMPRVGRKLLLTGSGKCNISNVDMGMEHFHCYEGADYQYGRDIISNVLNRCSQKDTLGMLAGLGLFTRERKGGLYPYCEQASSVVDILRFAIRERNIDLHIETDIKRIEKQVLSNDRDVEDKFSITTSSGKLSFDRVILCCGSSANRNTGSDGSGYELAKSLGHTLVKPLPALTNLTCEEDFYPSIAGIRTPAKITLLSKGVNSSYMVLGSDTGELQLTKSGISGVCVFNLSYLAIRALDEGNRVKAIIDFIPDIDDADIHDFMKERAGALSERTLEELFIGLLAKPLGILICKRCSLDLRRKCSELSDRDIEDICRMVKGFDTMINGSGDMENSQVAQGGVKLSEIDDNLESRICSGLFFAGEILDVNGDCGGYNLQWAASSGMFAGREAAK